jgi:hypothetical protein
VSILALFAERSRALLGNITLRNFLLCELLVLLSTPAIIAAIYRKGSRAILVGKNLVGRDENTAELAPVAHAKGLVGNHNVRIHLDQHRHTLTELRRQST